MTRLKQISEQVVARFGAAHRTLGTAESLTGGMIASSVAGVSGASAVLMGGVVSYDPRVKHEVLGVSQQVIDTVGVVSEPCARQMAEGARRISGADYAVATTGIAGPTGGSAQKPVGTVWMAVATPRGTYAVVKQCGTDRGQIIDRASAFAIGMLHELLDKEEQTAQTEAQAEKQA